MISGVLVVEQKLLLMIEALALRLVRKNTLIKYKSWEGKKMEIKVNASQLAGAESFCELLEIGIGDTLRLLTAAFAPQLENGWQAVVELAIYGPRPQEILMVDVPFSLLCERDSLWTAVALHFQAGKSGSFAKVKVETLRRNSKMPATGAWVSMQEVREAVSQTGAKEGLGEFWKHADEWQLEEASQLTKLQQALLRDCCGLTAFPGGIRVPITVLGKPFGEFRISFSGLTSEQDVLMACYIAYQAEIELSRYGRKALMTLKNGKIVNSRSKDTEYECNYAALMEDRYAGVYLNLMHLGLLSSPQILRHLTTTV